MLALHRDFGKPEIAAAVHCSEHTGVAPSAIGIAGQRGGSTRAPDERVRDAIHCAKKTIHCVKKKWMA
jgi:hypothetical protein